ncbi:TPA: polymerase [Streptococcus pneumoniae]
MKITIKRYSLPEILGLAALAIFLLFSLLDVSFYVQYISPMLYKAAIFLIIMLIILKEFVSGSNSFESLLGLLGVSTLYFITGSVTSYTSFIVLGLSLIYSLRDIPFSKVVKVAFIISVAMLFLVILSSKIGFIPDYIEFSSTRVRHYLGFRYSLFPSTIMMNIIAISFFLKQETVSYQRLFILFLVSMYLYLETDSRLTFISSSLLLLANLAMKLIPTVIEKFSLLLKFFTLTYFVNAYLSYWISKNYLRTSNALLNHFFHQADQFLGGRIYLSNRSLSLYGYGILGQKIAWVGNALNAQGERSTDAYLYVDNLYIQILQHFGLIALIIILSLLTATLVKLLRKGQIVLSIIIVSLSFHALIDDLILSIHYNIFWILLGSLIYSNYQFSEERYGEVENDSLRRTVREGY